MLESCTTVDDFTFIPVVSPEYTVHWWAHPREMVVREGQGHLIADGVVLTVERRRLPIYKVRLEVRRWPMKSLRYVREQWPKNHFVQHDELFVATTAEIRKWDDRGGVWKMIEPKDFYVEIGAVVLPRGNHDRQ